MILEYLVCFVLALSFSSSVSYINTGECTFVTLEYCAKVIIYFLIFILLFKVVRILLKRMTGVSEKIRLAAFERKYSVFIIATIIFLLWLPTFILLFPGTVINDTWGQLGQYMEYTGTGNYAKGILYDHHPIFDTFFMGIIITGIKNFTGQWNLALFGYVLIQAIFSAIAFAYTIEYTYNKLKLDARIGIVMILIYSLLPIFPMSVQTISKDALFSWTYVIFSVMFIEIVRTKADCLLSKRFMLAFIFICILNCLTKKVGVYIVLISIGVATFIKLKKIFRLYLIIPIFAIITVMYVLMPIVIEATGTIKGGQQEMLSIPFQQTARYVKYHGDDITDYEYEVIDKVLWITDLSERYDPINADPVKGYTPKGKAKDYSKYIKVWISQGLRHPKTYIEAFAAMESGWFSWTEYSPIVSMDWHNQLNAKLIPEKIATRPDISEYTTNSYQNIIDELYQIPFIKLFFTYGLYASIIPGFIFATVFRKFRNKDIKYWIATVPMFLSIALGCWLAPVSIAAEGKRYLYPVIYTIPLMLAWCIYIYKRENTSIKKVEDKING